MELLKLSIFKLQLRALITEVRELRERERSATDQLQHLSQKHKQTEEEYGRKLQELQAELASSNEMIQKLERKVNNLENENALLENNQKELKGTIHNLLQTRESFINAYEESTCEMKRSIEARDRKLAVLSEKINAHILLFDSIENEAFSTQQVLSKVQRIVSEKEEEVANLRSKLDNICALEIFFTEKIHELESKLKNDEDESRRKDKIISELEAQLEGAKISNNCQTQMAELHETLYAKDAVINNLEFEKKGLQYEVRSLGLILQNIKDTVLKMNEEDNRMLLPVLEHQEACEMDTIKEDSSTVNVVQNTDESPHEASGRGTAENTGENKPISKALRENHNLESCVSEACSPQQSAGSEPQSAANMLCISENDVKDHTELQHPLESECSTTGTEASHDPGSGQLVKRFWSVAVGSTEQVRRYLYNFHAQSHDSEWLF